MHRTLTPTRFRRAVSLGRAQGRTAGATAARRAIEGGGTLIGAFVSLLLFGGVALVLSVVFSLLFGVVGSLLVLLIAGAWLLVEQLTLPQAEQLALVLLLLVGLVLLRRRIHHPPPPAAKDPPAP
jgi:MYXO-CTERM domain-containing protein